MTKTMTSAPRRAERSNGHARVSTRDVERLFDEDYREVEVLSDGTLRQAPTDPSDETVTRSLKTQRTWY